MHGFAKRIMWKDNAAFFEAEVLGFGFSFVTPKAPRPWPTASHPGLDEKRRFGATAKAHRFMVLQVASIVPCQSMTYAMIIDAKFAATVP